MKHLSEIREGCAPKKKHIDEGSVQGIFKALTNLAKQPGYKKVAKALLALTNPSPTMKDKQIASGLKKRLGQLAQKVGPKEKKKLLAIADLASTYESVELEEGVSLSKKGDYEVTADGKSGAGIQGAIRYKGKMLYAISKEKGKFVVGFPKGFLKKNKISDVVFRQKGKFDFVSFDKADHIIDFMVRNKITEELEEAVKVDMRTKGYKEAIKRGVLKKEKREARKAKLEAQKEKEMEEEIANTTGVNIAGHDKPLGSKCKTFKRHCDK